MLKQICLMLLFSFFANPFLFCMEAWDAAKGPVIKAALEKDLKIPAIKATDQLVEELKKRNYARNRTDEPSLQEVADMIRHGGEEKRKIIVAAWQAVRETPDANQAPKQAAPTAGMQEIEKHRVEFQAALKKVHDAEAAKDNEKKYDQCPSPTRSLYLQIHRDQVAENKKTADVLMGLFDAAIKSLGISMQDQKVHQELQVALRKLESEENKILQTLVTQLKASCVENEVAIKELQEAGLKSKFKNQKQKRLIKEQQATISEKNKVLEQAAIELAKENASLVQLQHIFLETTDQLAQLKAAFKIVQEENVHLKKTQCENILVHTRILSLFTLYEKSQLTGWETLFIQAIKEELK